jgi:hypothetical protein
MGIETDYDPEYVTLDDIPLSGPDRSYSAEDKRKALFSAESSLEMDVNNGERIKDDELHNAHKAAVMNLATHILTHAAEDPSNATIGDMQDGGGTITDYSSRYLDEYLRITDSLRESGSGNHGNFTVAVNSGVGDDKDRYWRKYDTGAPPEFRALDSEHGDNV